MFTLLRCREIFGRLSSTTFTKRNFLDWRVPGSIQFFYFHVVTPRLDGKTLNFSVLKTATHFSTASRYIKGWSLWQNSRSTKQPTEQHTASKTDQVEGFNETNLQGKQPWCRWRRSSLDLWLLCWWSRCRPRPQFLSTANVTLSGNVTVVLCARLGSASNRCLSEANVARIRSGSVILDSYASGASASSRCLWAGSAAKTRTGSVKLASSASTESAATRQPEKSQTVRGMSSIRQQGNFYTRHS